MPSEMSLNVVNKVRSVLKHFVAIEQSEGAGALVKRSIGTGQMRNFPPFLMLDNFEVTPPAGFPEHPHHGQETITYVLRGMMAHEDFTGSKGVLRPGDLQFMTAGQAIVHSEIPVKMDNGESTQGLQLWVDLPNDMKNVKPRYRDLRREEIPLATPSDSLKVKVISGESYGLKSLAELAYTPVEFYHFIASKKNTEFAQPLQDQFSSFIYVMKGSINISNKEYPEFSTIFFKNDGDGVKGFTTSDDAEFAVISGKYFNQKVVQYGPFVESSRENIIDVIQNYQNGANGFENAKTWSPVIKSGVTESEVQQYLPKSD
ncbi:unnamed protein product [Kluyveromyces dobzhanskii CBS 2104]|uniref:WGS project CCBQ000000000 data, contig 00098 n=1 Tax=Kluyveromyces dobzhanskii CBS 2104 TaxID=1427455 RepID=A0A0A8L5B6_9SACH|nr:unnamed protein product [Kluyveromyces dobzhanskii CBS 2104]